MKLMVCKYCQERIDSHEHVKREEKIVLKISENMFSEFPICAFKGDKYTKDNWACQTMFKLREIADYHGWNNDESIDVIHIPEDDNMEAFSGYLVLTYYKGRGRSGNAYIMCDNEIRELTLDEAYKIIEIRGESNE